MNACSDSLPIEAEAKKELVTSPPLVVFAEALFFLWIALFAGLTLLLSLVLTIVGILSVINLLYIYVGISVVTVFFGLLLYYARYRASA